jgi:hypothetical protein
MERRSDLRINWCNGWGILSPPSPLPRPIWKPCWTPIRRGFSCAGRPSASVTSAAILQAAPNKRDDVLSVPSARTFP